ncbi:hypothetical protein NA57DRAFT_38700 [Rhizodiscina lignyota]|uniref:Xylanolytic transcriptional activator regulatory domain-containing protein n=1 Tax=Rhizodiscina lignyota TaxID=1504668 RepID=A0A9P4IF70_9PEZI|nr:hypothetical protein NA57DRAFT_38700 [Rhizodiscina lignyota]
MYPSHELQTRPQSPFTPDPSPERPNKAGKMTVESVCEGLKISTDTYHFLMECYFANMTTYSLFKPHSIESKLPQMRSRAEAEALIAAMFSFSARFDGGHDFAGRTEDCPAPNYFAHIASSQLDRALNECGDMTPPLWVLQACILVTFYQLTRSVRSRSWRALGSCIRLAYDMQLHIVDANHDREAAAEGRIDLKKWSAQEERRRAWWAIWEMDVFASTIRRLPTAIDWAQNMTLLPVHDHYWFNDLFQNSTFLVHDINLRWKCLAKSGNNSPRAWFIVINSLMRNTQLIVYPPGSAMQSPYERRAESSQADLDIMANCLYCTVVSLPPELSYSGETLDFHTRGSPRDINPRQYHCDKYSLHLMTQLARFMFYHHKVSAQAPWVRPTGEEQANESNATTSEWSNYISAADEIVTAIRNSSKDHYKYVNPFLMNCVWFAAAAQCACKVFGPATFDKRVADSNLALLRLTVERFITFWGSADTLKSKLARMEQGLKSLMAKENGESAPKQEPSSATRHESSASQPSFTPQSTETLPVPYQTPGTDQSMPYTAVDPGDPDASQGLMSNPYDFTQPFLMPDVSGFLSGPTEYFPYGLEELLMYGSAPGQQLPAQAPT